MEAYIEKDLHEWSKEMNTIDLLKENQTAWKWVTPAQKSELLAAKKHGAMVFMDKNGYWQKHSGLESMGVVYRISKNYAQPIKRKKKTRILDIDAVLSDIEELFNRIEQLEVIK